MPLPCAITAANLTAGAVQAAIDSAIDGQTVCLPAGTMAWSSSVVVDGKAIRLQGAGGGRIDGSSTTSVVIGTGTKTFTLRAGSVIRSFTVGETVRARVKYLPTAWMEGTVTSWNGTALALAITSTGGSGTYTVWTFERPALTIIQHDVTDDALFLVSEATAGSVSIGHLRLVQGTGTGSGIWISPTLGGLPVVIHDLRVSHIPQGIRFATARGVVSRACFDDGFDWVDGVGNATNVNGVKVALLTSDSWVTADTLGTHDLTGASNVYVENCYFTGLTLNAVDFTDYARGVLRHCVLDNSGITTHGQDTAEQGIRHGEFLNNLGIFDQEDGTDWTADVAYWIQWRGGSGIFTGNTLDPLVSQMWGEKTAVALQCQPLRRNYGPLACWSAGYPCPRQVGQGHNGTTGIVEGVYIWDNVGDPSVATQNYVPSGDGCDPEGPDIGEYIQLDRDYFLTAKPGYVPYTYPHPLITALDALEETPPSSPPSLSMVLPLNVPTRTGALFTTASVSATNWFLNSGREVLVVRNGGEASVIVTVDAPGTCNFQLSDHAAHDLVVVVPATAARMIGPFAPRRFNPAGSLVRVTWSHTADVTASMWATTGRATVATGVTPVTTGAAAGIDTMTLVDGATVRMSVAPQRLAIYYGVPSQINGAVDLAAAVTILSDYDVIVLADGLEDPGNPDSADTGTIIAGLAATARNTVIYGYIDLGNTQNLSLGTIATRIAQWATLGAHGIFFDEAGYDFGVTRTRQNAAVTAARTAGMRTILNAWEPADVVGSDVVPLNGSGGGNPDGIDPVLTSWDAILLESFAVINGVAENPTEIASRAATAMAARTALGIQVFGVTTSVAETDPTTLWPYAWWVGTVHGVDAIGWGQPNYSSADSLLPWLARPAAEATLLGAAFTGAISFAEPTWTRTTSAGTIDVNSTTLVGTLT